MMTIFRKKKPKNLVPAGEPPVSEMKIIHPVKKRKKWPLIFCFIGCFLFAQFVPVYKSQAIIPIIVGLVVSIVASVAADMAKSAAHKAMTGNTVGNGLFNFAKLFNTAELGSAVGLLTVAVLKWIRIHLENLNAIVMGFVFGDLLVLIDYQKLPVAGDYVKKLYAMMQVIAVSLAGLFFSISSGVNVVRIVSKGSWKDVFHYTHRLFWALLLIAIFPYIYSISMKLVGDLSNEIMSVHIKGEAYRHAPTGTFKDNNDYNYVDKPLAGLALVEDRIDYVLNLPDNIVNEARSAVNDAANRAVGYVENKVGSLIDEAADKTVNKAIDTGINAVANAISKDSSTSGTQYSAGSSGGSGGFNSGSASDVMTRQDRLEAVIHLLTIVISIMSLTLIFGLFVLKGLQLVALMLLFILAPLAFAFLVLPVNENFAGKFLRTFYSIMGWNIIWAIGIKLYFIIRIIVNYFGDAKMTDALAGGAALVLPFAGIFMDIGLMAIMMGVAGWIGVIVSASVAASAGTMGQQMMALPALVQSIGGGVSKATAGTLQTVGKIHALASNPVGATMNMADHHFDRGREAVIGKSLNYERNISSDKSMDVAKTCGAAGKRPVEINSNRDGGAR